MATTQPANSTFRVESTALLTDMHALPSGRSEAELEYDVGFDNDGRISALSVRGWFLAGADLDLAWNDMMILQTGADQVSFLPS